MNILEAEGLKKQFGSHKVLEDVSMYVPEHCIYGFLGKNGAGKTTTMKMILGLLKPDEGSIHVSLINVFSVFLLGFQIFSPPLGSQMQGWKAHGSGIPLSSVLSWEHLRQVSVLLSICRYSQNTYLHAV